MDRLYSIEDVGERFGLTVQQVARKCSAADPWPHLRPSRASSTWKVTEGDVAEIEARMRGPVAPPPDTWGRTRPRRK